MTTPRFQALDALRGIAVMGILLMNIVAFAQPSAAYINPYAYGNPGSFDISAWFTMSVLVDAKMRALFSIMFGASMVLVYDRAEANSGNGQSVHLRRMIWLLAFGLVHYYFIWFGDILSLYALCGMLGVGLLKRDEAQLIRAAKWLFGINFIVMAIIASAVTLLAIAASLPDADADLVKSYKELSLEITPNAKMIAKELTLHLGSYSSLVTDRLFENGFDPLLTFIMSGLETLGLMVIGMILFRNGFLTGTWADEQYLRTMRRMYLIGFPPIIALNFAFWYSNFSPALVLGSFTAWAMPFRIAVAVGHAALAMVLIRRFAHSGIIARIEAAGKVAFTNYLGTSILMTTLFYGYGFGLYGKLSLLQTYALVPLIWALMLLWSKPWLDRYHYGPLEWLWRSLSRGSMQPMRKAL
jgi:uncharacterized protein